MASSWDNNSDCGSEISRATSDITAEPTGHAQQRMAEREIEQRDFQAAKKHGVKERHRDHVDRWVFKHNGSRFVTNETTEKLITVIPPRGWTAVVEIPTGDRNADARWPDWIRKMVKPCEHAKLIKTLIENVKR